MTPKRYILATLLIAAGASAQSNKPSSADAAGEHEIQWNADLFVGTYNRLGHKSPKWDTPVSHALHCEARKWAYYFDTPTCDEDDQLWDFCEKADKAKCDDPIFLYIAARTADTYGEVHRRDAFAIRAADGMTSEDYPPILKFYAFSHAADSLIAAKGKLHDAKKAADYFAKACDLIPTIAADSSIPRGRMLDAFDVFCDAARAVNGVDAEHDQFSKALATFAKSTADQSLVCTLEAAFDLRWAWLARGTGWASEVPADSWPKFTDRVQLARTAAEKAWQLDPSNYLAADSMMDVCLAQALPRDQVDQWYTRALEGNPNACAIDRGMLNYLEPKWFGSQEAMIEHGRQCVKSNDWDRRRPLVLIDAYLLAAHYDSNTSWQPTVQKQYFKNHPQAFDEIKPVYEEYLRRNPKSVFHRTRYAFIAAWSERWADANGQFEILGNKWSALWGSEQEMRRMKASVKSHIPAFPPEPAGL